MYKTWIDQVGTVHEGKIVATKNNYDAIECDLCGYIHIIPLPDEKDLNSYYSDIFYSDFKPDYIANHEKDLLWWNHIYEQRHRLFIEHGKYSSGYKPRILDIGSGPGFFLKYFDELNWDTVGIEPSNTAAEFSKGLGLEVWQKSFYEISEEDIGKFDVIHSNQTFEHLLNPNEALIKLKSLLKPNGLIFLCVANDFNPIQLILTEKMDYSDWWFIPPEHINYFSIQSISQLIEKSGFEELICTTTFPIDIFLLMGDNYILDNEIGSNCHSRRKQLELNLFQSDRTSLKNSLYHSFSENSIGREIEILAKLKN